MLELTIEQISMGQTAMDKSAALQLLADKLVADGLVAEGYLSGLQAREAQGSTFLGQGIAIPHGKTNAVDDLVACIGVSDHGVDFEALDQEDCRIFILTLSPSDKTGPHLQFLAEVSLLFKSEDKRLAIMAAKDPGEVLAILTN